LPTGKHLAQPHTRAKVSQCTDSLISVHTIIGSLRSFFNSRISSALTADSTLRQMNLQAKKFSDTLIWVIEHLEHPHELCQELRALGARHGGYGVKIDQYAPVGSALIWMFQRALGDRFTPEMEEAWLEFYAFASFEMERGSREAAA